ncbi:lys-63-specific deubiquitinase BRCC36 isoform X2 [Pseudorca crassidens]|uniref:lys-63-specific deubiquitinase BRCC36 isoform X2 n=1 Tax=Pseudorca crassidens TaxID=82174 RepID=UPI00352CB1F7
MAVQVVQAVQAVHLESDAFLVCLNHALSTEKEEVMGLCIGEVSHPVSPAGTLLSSPTVSPGWVLPAPRAAEATGTPDSDPWTLAELTGRPMRVVGWYHSHPHITVWPSHVDVRTQAMYQMMDQGFVGLIFSCFIEDKNTKTGRVLYTCFQSIQAQKSSEYERIEIPIHIVPHVTIGKVCLESAVELPKILCQEEQDAYRRIHSLTHLDSVTKIHNGSARLPSGLWIQGCSGWPPNRYPLCSALLPFSWLPIQSCLPVLLLHFFCVLLLPPLSVIIVGRYWWWIVISVFFLLKCLPRTCAVRCRQSAGLYCSGWRTDWSKTNSICRSCNKKRKSLCKNFLL